METKARKGETRTPEDWGSEKTANKSPAFQPDALYTSLQSH